METNFVLISFSGKSLSDKAKATIAEYLQKAENARDIAMFEFSPNEMKKMADVLSTLSKANNKRHIINVATRKEKQSIKDLLTALGRSEFPESVNTTRLMTLSSLVNPTTCGKVFKSIGTMLDVCRTNIWETDYARLVGLTEAHVTEFRRIFNYFTAE